MLHIQLIISNSNSPESDAETIVRVCELSGAQEIQVVSLPRERDRCPLCDIIVRAQWPPDVVEEAWAEARHAFRLMQQLLNAIESDFPSEEDNR